MKYLQVRFLIVLFLAAAFAMAQDSPVLSLNIPYQNSLMYNRFLFNPTFSYVGETEKNISLYSRSQWIGFNDAPKVYLLNYSGRFSERTGFGIGLYQQNIGVISSFGGIGNAAYFVPLQEEMGLTLGTNLVFYSSGVDMSRVAVEDADPLLLSLDSRSLFSFHPGFNFNYKKFDVGAYAENLVNYDFKQGIFVKDYAETTFSGHIAYTHFLENQQGTLKALARFRNNRTYGFDSGLSFLADFPRLGWVQTGFDTYYGLALGVGFHLSKKLSVGYVYEKASRAGMQNLGSTHEFNLVFTLPNEKSDQTPNVSPQSTKSKTADTSKKEFEELENSNTSENKELIPTDTNGTPDLHLNAEAEKKTVENTNDQDQLPLSVIGVNLEQMDEQDIQRVFSKNTAYKRKSPDQIGQVTVPTVNSGYYIVAGVFSKSENSTRLLSNLYNKRISARVFVNPENKYKYVYLRYYNSRKEALAAYYSNLENTYFETIWILRVDQK